MTSRPKNLIPGAKIRHKDGKDYIVQDSPYYDKFYCRTADAKKEFKVIELDNIEFVHSSQARLEF